MKNLIPLILIVLIYNCSVFKQNNVAKSKNNYTTEFVNKDLLLYEILPTYKSIINCNFFFVIINDSMYEYSKISNRVLTYKMNLTDSLKLKLKKFNEQINGKSISCKTLFFGVKKQNYHINWNIYRMYNVNYKLSEFVNLNHSILKNENMFNLNKVIVIFNVDSIKCLSKLPHKEMRYLNKLNFNVNDVRRGIANKCGLHSVGLLRTQ